MGNNSYEVQWKHFRDKEYWSARARVIGLRVQMARKLAGRSQEQLAYLVGLSHMKVHRIEAGKYPPDMIEIIKIAEATNKEFSWFFQD